MKEGRGKFIPKPEEGRVPGFVVVIGLVYRHSTLGKMHAHQLLSQTLLSFPVSYYLIMLICEGSV